MALLYLLLYIVKEKEQIVQIILIWKFNSKNSLLACIQHSVLSVF